MSVCPYALNYAGRQRSTFFQACADVLPVTVLAQKPRRKCIARPGRVYDFFYGNGRAAEGIFTAKRNAAVGAERDHEQLVATLCPLFDRVDQIFIFARQAEKANVDEFYIPVEQR